MSSHYYQSQPLAGQDLSAKSRPELQAMVKQVLQNKLHGLCFSPFTEQQGPKSIITKEQIRERLTIIAPHVSWIRTFSSTRGHQLIPEVAKEFGLGVLGGVWLDDDLENNEEEMAGGIELANKGLVDLLGVGNEVMLREELTEEQLIEYLERAKQNTGNVPVGYVDAYYLFNKHEAVADACEVIFANCYPFWEGYELNHALVYMKEMYRRATVAAKGKPVVISETGWPNKGTPDRQAVPSYENAIKYFVNTCQWVEEENIPMFYFAAFDEAWKVEKEGDVGAYWGLWDADGKTKYC